MTVPNKITYGLAVLEEFTLDDTLGSWVKMRWPVRFSPVEIGVLRGSVMDAQASASELAEPGESYAGITDFVLSRYMVGPEVSSELYVGFQFLLALPTPPAWVFHVKDTQLPGETFSWIGVRVSVPVVPVPHEVFEGALYAARMRAEEIAEGRPIEGVYAIELDKFGAEPNLKVMFQLESNPDEAAPIPEATPT